MSEIHPVSPGITESRLAQSLLASGDDRLLEANTRERQEAIDSMRVDQARRLVDRLASERGRLMEVIGHLDDLRSQTMRATGASS